MMDAKLVNQFLAGVAGAELLPPQERIAAFLALKGAKVARPIRPGGKSRFTLPQVYEAMRRGRSI